MTPFESDSDAARMLTMRLRDAQVILAITRGKLKHNYANINLPNGSPGGQLDQVETWLPAVRRLAEIPVLRRTANSILGSPLVKHASGGVAAGPRHEAEGLQNYLTHIESRASDLEGLIADALVKPPDPQTVAVRLPELSTFEDLAKLIDELQRVFDFPNRRLLGDGFQVRGFDTGSNWVELWTPLVGVLTATAWLIRICEKHATAKAEKLSAAEKLRTADAAIDRHIVAVVEANERFLKEALRADCTDLVEGMNPDADTAVKTESITLYLDAAERLTTLMERGAAVKLALNAPQQAKDALPGGKDIAELVAGLHESRKLLGQGGRSDATDGEGEEPGDAS